MNEGEKRRRAADTALSLLGSREADGSFLPILEAYNRIRPLPRGYRMKESDPWCAAFVSAVGSMAGLGDALLPECGCAPMIALYRARGRWRGRDAEAQPGDLVFYDWEGDGEADHVGLVTARSPEGYEVVEGNAGGAVALRRVPKGWARIAGFAFPDYGEGESAGEEAPETEKISVPLPVLRRGERGESVRAMQALLIVRGCGCGPDGADGDFGANTLRALRALQTESGLGADGICGAESWKKLLGVSA